MKRFLVALFLLGCKLPAGECLFQCEANGQCAVGTCGQDGYCHSDGNLDHCIAPANSDGGGGDGLDPALYNYVFVSSQSYAPASLGSPSGADQKCQALGEAKFPGRHFVAWFSNAASDVKTRLRTPGGTTSRGWIRPDGRPFADSLTKLLDDGQIFYPLRLDENSRDLVSGTHVLVATFDNGNNTIVAGDANCAGRCWRDGYPNESPSQPKPLYCFGTDYDRALVVQPAQGRIAFLSGERWAPSGIASADALCTTAAKARSLPGTFLALLSMGGGSAASRFAGTEPWVRLDGIVWSTPSELSTGRPLTALNLDQTGKYHGESTDRAWAGAQSPGLTSAAGENCNDWMAMTQTGLIGAPYDSGPQFFNAFASVGNSSCASMHPLYCLQSE